VKSGWSACPKSAAVRAGERNLIEQIELEPRPVSGHPFLK